MSHLSTLALGVSLLLGINANAEELLYLSRPIAPADSERGIYFDSSGSSAEGYTELHEALKFLLVKRAIQKAAIARAEENLRAGPRLTALAVIPQMKLEVTPVNRGHPNYRVVARLTNLILSEQKNPATLQKLATLVFTAFYNNKIAIEVSLRPEEIVLTRISPTEMKLGFEPEAAARIRDALDKILVSPALIFAKLAAIPEGYENATASIRLSRKMTRDLLQVPRGERMFAGVKSCLASLIR